MLSKLATEKTFPSLVESQTLLLREHMKSDALDGTLFSMKKGIIKVPSSLAASASASANAAGSFPPLVGTPSVTRRMTFFLPGLDAKRSWHVVIAAAVFVPPPL